MILVIDLIKYKMVKIMTAGKKVLFMKDSLERHWNEEKDSLANTKQ